MSNATRRQFLRSTLLGGVAVITVATIGTGARADGHATAHTVRIAGSTFRPAQLTIKVGDTVTFVNEDGAPHTATANNGSFDTGRLSRGQSAELQFASAGRLDYFCTIHRGMKGVITVE